MINEQDFYNVLIKIATHLKSISESLQNMDKSRRTEVAEQLKESRRRQRDSRIVLGESNQHKLNG